MSQLDGGIKRVLIVKAVHRAAIIQFGAMKNVGNSEKLRLHGIVPNSLL